MTTAFCHILVRHADQAECHTLENDYATWTHEGRKFNHATMHGLQSKFPGWKEARFDMRSEMQKGAIESAPKSAQ